MEPSLLLAESLSCQSSGRQISDQDQYHKPELALAELGGLMAGGVIFQIVTDGRRPMRYSSTKNHDCIQYLALYNGADSEG